MSYLYLHETVVHQLIHLDLMNIYIYIYIPYQPFGPEVDTFVAFGAMEGAEDEESCPRPQSDLGFPKNQ